MKVRKSEQNNHIFFMNIMIILKNFKKKVFYNYYIL